MRPPVNLWALSALLAADRETAQLNHTLLLALAHVCASDEPVSVTAIAEAIRVSQSQASRVVFRLEEAGMLTREMPRTKPVMIRATQAGYQLDARVKAHVDASLAA